MKMEQTECSETSAYKIQTPGNYQEENIQHFRLFSALLCTCMISAGISCTLFMCDTSCDRMIVLERLHAVLNITVLFGYSIYSINRSQWPCGLYCDGGFRSRRGHRCLSLVSVVCFQVEVTASGWSLVQRSPTKYCHRSSSSDYYCKKKLYITLIQRDCKNRV